MNQLSINNARKYVSNLEKAYRIQANHVKELERRALVERAKQATKGHNNEATKDLARGKAKAKNSKPNNTKIAKNFAADTVNKALKKHEANRKQSNLEKKMNELNINNARKYVRDLEDAHRINQLEKLETRHSVALEKLRQQETQIQSLRDQLTECTPERTNVINTEKFIEVLKTIRDQIREGIHELNENQISDILGSYLNSIHPNLQGAFQGLRNAVREQQQNNLHHGTDYVPYTNGRANVTTRSELYVPLNGQPTINGRANASQHEKKRFLNVARRSKKKGLRGRSVSKPIIKASMFIRNGKINKV